MRREPDSILTLIPTLLDFKLSNIKVDEGNLRVFTIQDFLAQYNINTRTVGIHAILVPNNFTSTTDYNLNNYRTLIGNFTVKYYHFVGGFNNINFIELNFGINQDIINSIVNTALEQAIQYIEDNILNEDFIQNITQIVQTNVLSNLSFNDTDDIDFSKEGNNISAITIGWTGRFKDFNERVINVSNGLIKNVWLKEEAPYTLTVINGTISSCCLNMILNTEEDRLSFMGYIGNYDSNYGDILIDYGDNTNIECISPENDGGTWIYHFTKSYTTSGIHNVKIYLPICIIKYINITNANVSKINILDFPDIEDFELVNQLVNLNFPSLNNFKALKYFSLNNGIYTDIDFSVLPLLEILEIGSSDINNLNIKNINTLNSLTLKQCSTNSSAINVEGLINLIQLVIVDTSININNLGDLTSIKNLQLQNVNMTDIDLSVIPSLEYLTIIDGISFINAFDFSQSPNLIDIDISGTSLDNSEITTSIYSVIDRTGLPKGNITFSDFSYTPEMMNYLTSKNWNI